LLLWAFNIGPDLLGPLSGVLFFGAPLIGIGGIIHVNRNYTAVRKAGIQAAREEMVSVAGLEQMENPETWSLSAEKGGRSLIKPAARYDLTSLSASNIGVNVHDDARVYMVSRTYSVGNDVNELYYDQITGVNYTDGKIVISLNDGRDASYPSSTEPDDALNSIRERLREFKREN